MMGQTIDSISYHPFPNVDSIEYWHSSEINASNQTYLQIGYNLYCNCTGNIFNQQPNKKYRNKIITTEGHLFSDRKDGDWSYWKDVRKLCCQDFLLDQDSIVTYKNGVRIKKQDHMAKYFFHSNDSIIVEPIVRESEFNYKVICVESNCIIFVNKIYNLRSFPKKDLDMELTMITTGYYERLARSIIQNKTKR
jgi:hypothetical protein